VRILFVHQNFPAQYVHIVRALARQGGHELVGLVLLKPGKAAMPLPRIQGVRVVGYRASRSSTREIHPWVGDLESKVIRGEACAAAVDQLVRQGFRPELICAHAGWGESLFLKDVLPEVPLLTYQEFFYRSRGMDLDFDPEFQAALDWQACARSRMKTANPLLNLNASDWCVTPTRFQRSSFPALWRCRMSVIHDGIDLAMVERSAGVMALTLPDGTVLRAGDPIVTFVNRRLEPYRGCHTFLRAIPAIQERQPQARIVIVGGTQGVSYGSACPQGEWKDLFLREIEGRYDPNRVHFTERLPHEVLLQLLRLSAAHVYLTYPFVLSWSLLEAMASGCAVVGSATAPVQEVIEHGRNGLLVDFFRPLDLAEAVAELLANAELRQRLGEAARATARGYGLEHCLPRQLALIRMVAGRCLGGEG
jgi:glycosyltransferase involved in cell wall biosynthesis